MRLTRDQVGFVSQHIVRGLIREGFITADQPEQVIDVISQILTDDLEAEDKLNEEVREMLKGFSDEIARGAINYQEIFRKVKVKLARERKMVI